MPSTLVPPTSPHPTSPSTSRSSTAFHLHSWGIDTDDKLEVDHILRNPLDFLQSSILLCFILVGNGYFVGLVVKLKGGFFIFGFLSECFVRLHNHHVNWIRSHLPLILIVEPSSSSKSAKILLIWFPMAVFDCLFSLMRFGMISSSLWEVLNSVSLRSLLASDLKAWLRIWTAAFLY